MDEKLTNIRCVLNTRTQKMWIEADGIVRCVCFYGVKQTLEDAKENFLTFIELVGNKSNVPMIIDVTGVKSRTKEYDEYLSLKSQLKEIGPRAVIVRSNLKRDVGNFIYGLKKPSGYTRLFTSEFRAKQWLKAKTNEA